MSLGSAKWLRCLIESLHAEIDGDKLLIVLMCGSGFPTDFIHPEELRALCRTAPAVERRQTADFVARCINLIARISRGSQDAEVNQSHEQLLQQSLSKVVSSRKKWEIDIERHLKRPRPRMTCM